MNCVNVFLKSFCVLLIIVGTVAFSVKAAFFETNQKETPYFRLAVNEEALKPADESICAPRSGKSGVYARPYSFDENKIDGEMLWRNTLTMFGAGAATMGFLYMMPNSFTNWEDDDKSPFRKWWDNVSREPVWDKDDLFLNYVTHPYAGAIYFMGARSSGANFWTSAAYSFALSTFFWEYGIEAFAERPSIQDLIVTPVAGAVLGEWFYRVKRDIIENDEQLWGSKAWGKTALFLMDPITEVNNIIWECDKPDRFEMHSTPMITRTGRLGYGLTFSLSF